MKNKDQTLLEQAYETIAESPFKFRDNTFHTEPFDKGYDTGPEDVPQYAKSKSPKTASPKTYHPATVRAFKQLMANVEEHVEDMPPELLDRVIAKLQQAKQAWGK